MTQQELLEAIKKGDPMAMCIAGDVCVDEFFKNHDAERARDVMEQHLGGSIETLKMSGKIEDREGGTGKK